MSYDPNEAYAISRTYMEEMGINHDVVTAAQVRLFREFADSGRPNTMEEHTRIAVECLVEGGASRQLARDLAAESLQSLRRMGVRNPTRILWKRERLMTRTKGILKDFGEVLVKEGRDRAITGIFLILQGKMNAKLCQNLCKETASFSPEQIETLKRFITNAVDTTLHHFLWMIEEQEDIDLVVYDEDKEAVSLKEVSDGLCGEIYTEEGWIERFSKFPPSIK